jgi:hypothetical protein
MLVSCPGDVTKDDLATLHRMINRWNVLLGEQFGCIVVPVTWNEHASAEFGKPPQDILNRQLVDVVDFAIAIFWGRLGSSTRDAESGTAEEIQRLHEADKPVSLLRCDRPVPREKEDLPERLRLQEYLRSLYPTSLLMSYEDEAGLANQVDTILTRLATTQQWEATASGTTTEKGEADVWPRIDAQEYTESDRKGRLRSKHRWSGQRHLGQGRGCGVGQRGDMPAQRLLEFGVVTESDRKGRLRSKHRWSLVLQNQGGKPARRVRFHLEADSEESRNPFMVHTNGDDPVIEVLAPGGEVRYPVLPSMQMADQARCTVNWTDDRGDRENVATVRL